MKKIILVLCFLSHCCYAVSSLSEERETLLNLFFRQLIQYSEGGYVLFGEKPVCIHGYQNRDDFYGEIDAHKASILFSIGTKAYKNLIPSPSNYIIHVYNNPDCYVQQYTHFLVINKKALLKVVSDNIDLFRLVLGHKLTPESFLTQLIDPNETFYNVIKNNKALIGIILGFGTQNSLAGSRFENLEEILLSKEMPPHKSNLQSVSFPRKEMLHFAFMSNTSEKDKRGFTPSFGYSSIEEEIHDLSSTVRPPSMKLIKEEPNLLFGRFANDNMDSEICAYENCQDRIQTILKDPNFLEIILEKLNVKNQPNTDNSTIISFNESEMKSLPSVVALSIWNELKAGSEEYQKAFFEGCHAADADTIEEPERGSFDYPYAYQFDKIAGNLNETNKLFTNLSQNNNYQELVANKLYIRTIRKGEGSPFKNFKQANFKTNFDYNCENCSTAICESVQTDLSKTITGFALGIQGMQVGEVREIYIHPELGYGFLTVSEKGKPLRALVELISFDKSENYSPEIQFESMEIPPYNLLESTRKAAFAEGYHIWKHYKKSPYLNLKTILSIIENKEIQSTLSDNEFQNIIRKLHWNIYFSNEE